jgi:hypothetical protein
MDFEKIKIKKNVSKDTKNIWRKMGKKEKSNVIGIGKNKFKNNFGL